MPAGRRKMNTAVASLKSVSKTLPWRISTYESKNGHATCILHKARILTLSVSDWAITAFTARSYSEESYSIPIYRCICDWMLGNCWKQAHVPASNKMMLQLSRTEHRHILGRIQYHLRWAFQGNEESQNTTVWIPHLQHIQRLGNTYIAGWIERRQLFSNSNGSSWW